MTAQVEIPPRGRNQIDRNPYVEKARQYFTEMTQIPKEIRPQITEWIQAAIMGDPDAKERLAIQLQSYFEYIGDIPIEPVYPHVPVYDSLIYATFGQMFYDAVIAQSPYVETTWIIANKPIRYMERGILKEYPYIPTNNEVEILQGKLSHIAGGTLHAHKSVLSGFIEATETRLQMYCQPRSRRRTIVTRRFVTPSFHIDDLDMDPKVRTVLKQMAIAGTNILLAGGMGVGKTQLALALLLLKDPLQETITLYESEHEMRLDQKWSGVVIEMQKVDQESLDDGFAHIFRNSTRTIVVGESRSPIEAHFVLESCLRGSEATITTLHLNDPSPETAIRTFAGLVNRNRREDMANVMRDIADGIHFFVMLDMDVQTGKRFVKSIFCPVFDETEQRTVAQHLVYYDWQHEVYTWTGEKIPANKQRPFYQHRERVDLKALQQLGVL